MRRSNDIQALLRCPVCNARLETQTAAIPPIISSGVRNHVADPYRCVGEIQRVLKAHGLAYAEALFMIQVHLQPYDFTRFTPLGQRR